MAKVVFLLFDRNNSTIQKLVSRKVISQVTSKGMVCVGRYGTNKTTLRKILKGWQKVLELKWKGGK